MPGENLIALLIMLGAGYGGYAFYPANPGRLASVLALVPGFLCLVVSTGFIFWLLTDTGGAQGSVGAWLLILSVGSLGLFAALILGIFAGAGCFVARLRKRN